MSNFIKCQRFWFVCFSGLFKQVGNFNNGSIDLRKRKKRSVFRFRLKSLIVKGNCYHIQN